VNGFGEIHDNTATTETGFRAGRQEIFFGNDLQVRANVSTNLPSPVFDGFRAYVDWGFARIDAFAYNVVNFENGILQDKDNAHTNLWGVYTSYALPRYTLAGTGAKISIDLFYFGWRSSPFAAGKASAILRRCGLSNRGEDRRRDRRRVHRQPGSPRHVRAARLRRMDDIDYDWHGAYQTGSYAGLTVDAFAVNTDTGYTLHDLLWKPRIGAHADIASGGASKPDGTMSTYQPMYPNTQYYAPNNEFAPTNLLDFAPSVSVRPFPTVTAAFYYSFLWRYSGSDAIYTGAPWPGGNGQNSYATTVLAP
jgi:hypothetical protein